MKSKAKLFSLAAAMAATLGVVGMAKADPTVQLTLVYAGYTQVNTTSSGNFGNATTGANPANLVTGPITPAVEALPNVKFVYDVYLSYNGGVADPNSNFQGLIFNVTINGAGVSGVSPSNVSNYPTATTSKKYFSFGTGGELTTNTDGGTAGDLQAITLLDQNVSGGGAFDNFGTTSDANTYNATNGGVLIGDFGLTLTQGPLPADAAITATLSPGSSYSFFTNPADVTAVSYGTAADFSSNTVTIPAAATTPEPASLGVLALGGIALLARRRKTA